MIILIKEPAVADNAIQGKLIATNNFNKSDLLSVNNLQDIIRMLLMVRMLLLLRLFLRIEFE